MPIDELVASSQQVLRDLCDDLMGLVGEEFFFALMNKLAIMAGADYAFIGQFLPDNPEVVRTVAVYADGHTVENMDFEIKNTPCDVVVKEGFKHYPHSVIELFPLDHLGVQMEVDSYVGIPLKDSHGKVLGPLAVFSRKPLKNLALAETAMHMFALRASAELERLAIAAQRQEELYFLQSLLDAIPNPVFYKNIAGAYLGCNRSYEAMLGIERQKLLGHQVDEVVPPARAQLAKAEDTQVFSSGEDSTYANEIICADGNARQVLFNKAPFYNSSGDLAGLVGTIQDITSLKQIEAAMQGLIEITVGFTGAECYHRVAQELCTWFDADCAIVGQLIGDGKILSLAMVQDGELLVGKTFAMAGTPCEKVVDDGVCLFSDGLVEHFPNSELVNNMRAQGYVGTPVHNYHGTIVGVLSVLAYQANGAG
ncbi:MAG: PAS domain-containing protein [Desulfuromonas sp.]|nr:PAS domain-containing protein [Desulfuromonas sp.]